MVRITRITAAAPAIDGRLDDPAWADAAAITDFVQVYPIEGGTPSQKTEVRICYDTDNLYIGIRCYDSEPGRILAKQMQKDGSLGSDDNIRIAIDTFLDRRNGYLFETGPAGARLRLP